jgi:hypothetical protein
VTTVFKIDDSGTISELATYSLSPKESVRNAFQQLIVRNLSTWNYDNVESDIKESKRGFHILFGKNSALFSKRIEV